jgi:hypothetical protein
MSSVAPDIVDDSVDSSVDSDSQNKKQHDNRIRAVMERNHSTAIAALKMPPVVFANQQKTAVVAI